MRSLPILFALLLLAGCATRKPPPPMSSPPPSAPAPAPAASLTPPIYVAVASNVSLFAVRASELAARRTSDPALRATAAKIAADQRGVGAQVSFAGRRLNLLPDAVLPPAMLADLAQLEASRDSDREYRRLVGRALARALSAHHDFAARGSSPTLRMVARFAEPVTARNLVELGGR